MLSLVHDIYALSRQGGPRHSGYQGLLFPMMNPSHMAWHFVMTTTEMYPCPAAYVLERLEYVVIALSSRVYYISMSWLLPEALLAVICGHDRYRSATRPHSTGPPISTPLAS